MSREKVRLALEKLEKHYPYEDESGVVKLSIGRYFNALQHLREVLVQTEEKYQYGTPLLDAIKNEHENIKNLRNQTLEEVATRFDCMTNFGDTAASFARYVRDMKE